MRNWTLIAALVATLFVASLAPQRAVAQGRLDVLEELVPPPRMLLRHQEELGLTDKQKADLKKVLKDAQAASLDLEFKVQEEAEKLAALIGAPKVDIPAALKQADALMAAENALKRVKLEMMLRTKALLTPAQLQKIDEVRAERREQRLERRRARPAATD